MEFVKKVVKKYSQYQGVTLFCLKIQIKWEPFLPAALRGNSTLGVEIMLIMNPRVLCSKAPSGFIVSPVFYSSEVDETSARNYWAFGVEKKPVSASTFVARRQLKLIG